MIFDVFFVISTYYGFGFCKLKLKLELKLELERELEHKLEPEYS